MNAAEHQRRIDTVRQRHSTIKGCVDDILECVALARYRSFGVVFGNSYGELWADPVGNRIMVPREWYHRRREIVVELRAREYEAKQANWLVSVFYCHIFVRRP